MDKKYKYGVAGLFFDGFEWQLSFASNTGYRFTPDSQYPNDGEGYKKIISLIQEKFSELQLSSTRVLLMYSPPGSTQFFPILYQKFPPVVVVHPERLRLHEERLNRTFPNKAELLVEAAVTGLSTELLLLETTNICTFSCLFCPQDMISRKKERMPFETAKKIVQEYAANAVGSIAFHLMGEPTTTPYLPRLVELVANYKIDHTLTTNASTLTKELSVDLFKSGLNRVQLSVQTFGEEQYLKYKRPAPTFSYEKVLNNIKDFFQVKWKYAPDAEVEIHVMDNSLYQPRGVRVVSNDEDAKAVVDFWRDFLRSAAAESGQEKIISLLNQGSDVRLARDAWSNVNYFFEPAISLKFKMAGHWTQEFLKEDEAVIVAKKGTCQQIAYGGSNQLAIQANGDAVLCCFDYDGGTKIGNIHKSSLRELDQKANLFRQRLIQSDNIPFKVCRRCLGIRVKLFSLPVDGSGENHEISLGRVVVYGEGKSSLDTVQQLRQIGVSQLALMTEEQKESICGIPVYGIKTVPEEVEAVIFPPEWHLDNKVIEVLAQQYPEKYIGQVDLVALNPFDRRGIISRSV